MSHKTLKKETKTHSDISTSRHNKHIFLFQQTLRILSIGLTADYIKLRLQGQTSSVPEWAAILPVRVTRKISQTEYLVRHSLYTNGWGFTGVLYLWVCQPTNVRFEVVNDSPARSWKGNTAHQEHEQHDVREGGCQIHHLSDTPPGCGHSSREGEKSWGIFPQTQRETWRKPGDL